MVMSVLAILAAVAIPNYVEFRDTAKTAVTKEKMQALRRAIVGDGRVVAGGNYVFPGFSGDMARLPTALSELVSQGGMSTYNAIRRSGWRGPYVDSTALSNYSTDAWGTALVYSEGSRYIRSWGPNKADDSGGDDDITLSF